MDVAKNLKLAILIPYRDRAEHLSVFLKLFPQRINLGRSKNPIDYEIFIIEQDNQKLFNRGMLLNIGFALTKDKFDYFCFHDVDMIPLSADYSYPYLPTHLAFNVSQFKETLNTGLPYRHYFGGVSLFNKSDLIKINGFSNGYWGWGSEDDDLLVRCVKNGLRWTRRIGTYESLPHPKIRNPDPIDKNTLRYFRTINGDLVDTTGLSDLAFILKAEKHYENPPHTLYSVDF